MNLREFSDNSWDIGLISGVLRGIKCTVLLTPRQVEAVEEAIKAIDRVQTLNQRQVIDLSERPKE